MDRGTDGLETKLEAGDDAEVSAAAANTPEQVGVLGVAGRQVAVGRDQLGPTAAGRPSGRACASASRSPAEGQTGQSGVGHRPDRNGQGEGLCGAVELAEQDTGLRPHRALLRVHPDLLHRPEVDHDPVVADRQPGKAVASAANGQREGGPSRERDGRADVGDVCAAQDRRGVTVDSTRSDPPVSVVRRVPRPGSPRPCRRAAAGRARTGRGRSVAVRPSVRLQVHRHLGRLP